MFIGLLNSVRDTRALGSIIFARIVYALNWLNVGAIFYLMESDLKSDVSGLGLLTGSFYLGIGVSQVPGGVLAARWGPKRVVVIGIFLYSLSALVISTMTTVLEIAILRFLVGVGMAFVFAPGVVMVTRLLRGERSGMGVGLFNSAFNIGGVIAVFGWIVVAEVIGWSWSIATSGGIGVLTGLLVLLYTPEDKPKEAVKVHRGALLSVLADRQLILLGLGTLGFGIGNTIISGFMVYYLNRSLSVVGTIAGLVTSLVLVVPVFSSIWGGRVYDSASRHRAVMVLAMMGSAAALSIAAVPSVYAAAACSALGGLASGVGYTFVFAGARDLYRGAREYEGLAIAWVNSIPLTLSFIPPVVFSYLVETFGYSQAWLGSAALGLIFLFPILLMVQSWKRDR